MDNLARAALIRLLENLVMGKSDEVHDKADAATLIDHYAQQIDQFFDDIHAIRIGVDDWRLG